MHTRIMHDRDDSIIISFGAFHAVQESLIVVPQAQSHNLK